MTDITHPPLPRDADRARPDATLLQGHLLRCESGGGRWFDLCCVAESVHGFLAPRFVTTLALASVLLLSLALAARA